MNSRRITYLFYRHFDSTATQDEQLELAELLQRYENDERFKVLMIEAWETLPAEKIFSDHQSEHLFQAIIDQVHLSQNTQHHESHTSKSFWDFPWKRLGFAASVLLALGYGLFFLKQKQNAKRTTPEVAAAPLSNDIAPGTSKAILTLDDGKNIILDNATEGLLATEDNVKVIKTGSDQLSYELSSKGDLTKSSYNTLSTPRGGQYKLVLPDGSKVWLNAASSIRYPTSFESQIRKVEIIGEAYFEINRLTRATGKKVPFIVEANGIKVEVLGTHFNINAYDDEEKIRTTLLEGTIKIHKGQSESLLKPGQQANVSPSSAKIQIQNVNPGQAVAWKNGFFQFHQASLEEIMRQLTKWYDVEVRYNGTITTRKFSGEIPREATLLQVLEILELSNVQLDIQGKEIIIKS